MGFNTHSNTAAEKDPPGWTKGKDGIYSSTGKALTRQEGGDHYRKYKIQPIEYAIENGLNFCQANAIKYITRYRDKGGKEDLFKAIHNIELLIEFEYGTDG